MAQKERIVAQVSADCIDAEEVIEGFKDALEKFGIKVYDDPTCDGTDSYGFLLSNEELTKDEIKSLTDY